MQFGGDWFRLHQLTANEVAVFCKWFPEWYLGIGLPDWASQLAEIQGFPDGPAFFLNFLLQECYRVDELLGARRASGDINIDGNHLVDALHERVIVEDAAGGGARPHGNHPLRLRHLLPQLADHGCHLVRHAAGDDHEIALPRRRTKNFRSKARNVEARRTHRHHLDGATREPERHRPDGPLAHPVHGRIHRGEHYSFRRGIAEGQILDHFLAVLEIDVGAEV